MDSDFNSDLETVKNFYDCWENKKPEELNLAGNFMHVSPFGIFNSRDEFLSECWKFSGIRLHNKKFHQSDNCIKVTYEIENGTGKTEVTEFVFLKDGLITKIEVKFGNNS